MTARRLPTLPTPPRGFMAVILPALLALMSLTAGLRAETTIKVPLADGFDFPVGKPNADGYYVFRGYYPGGHLGEDWNGSRGGDTDLGDPVYAAGDGVVVFSEDYMRGWGNVVIIRHAYVDENGRVALMDSLYGHLDQRTVRKYQLVKRGQQLGTIGTAHGKYAAHLHFEMRKNISIGMSRNAFDQGYANYFSPRQFLATHRPPMRAGMNVAVPVDTFKSAPDSETDGSVPAATAKAGAAGKDAGPQTPPKNGAKPAANDPKAVASADRDARLKKIVEDNRKKVDAIKDDDLDGFWARLRKKLDEERK